MSETRMTDEEFDALVARSICNPAIWTEARRARAAESTLAASQADAFRQGMMEAARLVDIDAAEKQAKAEELNAKGVTEFGALRHHEAVSLRGMARFIRERAPLSPPAPSDVDRVSRAPADDARRTFSDLSEFPEIRAVPMHYASDGAPKHPLSECGRRNGCWTDEPSGSPPARKSSGGRPSRTQLRPRARSAILMRRQNGFASCSGPTRRCRPPRRDSRAATPSSGSSTSANRRSRTPRRCGCSRVPFGNAARRGQGRPAGGACDCRGAAGVLLRTAAAPGSRRWPWRRPPP